MSEWFGGDREKDMEWQTQKLSRMVGARYKSSSSGVWCVLSLAHCVVVCLCLCVGMQVLVVV